MQCPSCQTPVDDSQRFCPTCGAGLSISGSPASDPLIGQVLGGKYRVIRLLGEGGMGAVYEGEQQLGTTRRKVAVKTLHPHLSKDPKIQARFEREVGTIAELEHPNTIQVFDFGSTGDGILYIVMEFLQGKSLADLLATDGAMSSSRVEHILAQVCGSLEEAHGRGIVHRDLKPDNIVLVERAGKKDFVKVLDFGIAKRAREEDRNEQKLTQQGMVLGTPPYMSPEQFSGTPIDARSDIYSLGILAYEMLTAQLPFKANTAWEWATQHMTQRPIPIESLAEGGKVNGAMRGAIERALAKSPDDRFQTVGEFMSAFSAPGAPLASTVANVSAPPRQKTEIGAPLPLEASGARASLASTPAPVGSTPAGGHAAFAAPAQIPHAPSREKSGGGRTVLLAAAGLIGVASVVAIALAVRGNSTGPAKDVVFDNGTTPAPATSLTPASVVSGGESPPADSAPPSPIPPLNAGGAGSPRPHPAPNSLAQGPGKVEPPTGTGRGLETPTLPVQPPAPPRPVVLAQPVLPSPPPAPATKYDGPECTKARALRALGHPREAQAWALACTAKGGSP